MQRDPELDKWKKMDGIFNFYVHTRQEVKHEGNHIMANV